MRKALTALALTATAFVAPLATTGTAYAAETADFVEVPAGTISVGDIADILLLPGGCTMTYVGKVRGTGVGPVVTTPPGQIVINYNAALTYVLAQTTNTLWYVGCI